MKSTFAQWGLMAALIASLAGCSGSGSSGAPSAGTGNVEVEKEAAKDPAANDPTKNPQAPWNALTALGVTPVTIQSPPVVNFAALDSIGKHVPGLKLVAGDTACGGNNVKLAIAKFNGSNWQSLISRQRYAADSAGQYAVVEAATDPIPTATITNPATALADPASRVVGILQENAASGYYTYYFATDVLNPLKLADAVDQKNVSPGRLANNEKLAVWDNATIHRVGVQLCFVDPQTKATVKVSPYLDFILDSAGVAHPVKDSLGKLTDARKVVDKASCNECHQALTLSYNDGLHDVGLVDPNFCVVCHNPGSTDYSTKNPIDLKLMVHKFHMGKKLKLDYQVKDFVARKNVNGVVTGVDFPQEQRNCVKCHDGSATAAHPTKDGNNWNLKPSKNACWACHDDYKDKTSRWYAAHQAVIVYGVDRDNPDIAPDSACAICHVDGTSVAPAVKHAVPEWTKGANYQYNIHAVTWNADRTVSVEFSVSNPVDGSVYDIKDFWSQYTTVDGAGTTTKNFVFGRLAMLFGWGSGDYSNAGAVAASAWGSSCTTVVPTGSPTCNAATGLPRKDSSSAGYLVTRGQPVAVSAFDAVPVAGTSNHFMLTSTVLPAAASGTGVVALQGSVSLQKDDNSSYAVPVKNAVSYFSIGGSGATVLRRTVVSADKCNVCHGKNINMNNHVPSHGANSTDPEVCVICHNGNNVLNGTTVAGGKVTVQPDSAHFKRLIHMKHKAMGANFPVMPRTNGSSNGSFTGYTGIRNCNVCHVNGSYKNDFGVMGSSTALDVDLGKDSSNATITDTDPSNNPVISPRAAACSACHADDTAKNHMINVGGAVFGTVTQGELGAGKVYEGCYGCHAPGGVAPVDVMHGLQ